MVALDAPEETEGGVMADVPDLPDLLAETEAEAAGSAWEAASERLVMYATPSFVEGDLSRRR